MAERYDLRIDQGSDKKLTLIFKDSEKHVLNLTGYRAYMQARIHPAVQEVVMELSTENGLIVITPLQGKLDISFPKEMTSSIRAAKYYYDLELVSDEETVRVIEGNLTITPEVTRV